LGNNANRVANQYIRPRLIRLSHNESRYITVIFNDQSPRVSTLHDALILIPKWVQEAIKASRAYVTKVLEGSNFCYKFKQPRENCDHPILGSYIILTAATLPVSFNRLQG
jgi:hypothetical protein